MSKIHIKPFFRFCKVKVLEQSVDIVRKIVLIEVEPDKRYNPICHKCGREVKNM
ncbi:MAG: hypothetical protein ACUVQ9_13490 [Thermodesulfobacteriota bacterium]